MKRARIVRTAALVLAFFAADIYAAQSPTFEAPNDFGIDRSLKALAAKAGENWREVAEKNRKPELKYLSKAKIIALMQKYADKETGDVGGEPLDEMPERFRPSPREPLSTRGVRVMDVGNFCVYYLPKDGVVSVGRILYCKRNVDAVFANGWE